MGFDYEISVKLQSNKNVAQNLDKYINDIRNTVSIPEELHHRIVHCMVEAVTNAAEHGNKYNSDKFVFMSISANSKQIVITVRDEGPGHIPDFEASKKMIESEENLFATRGRGLFLISELADEVAYDISNGTKLILCFDLEK